MTPPASTPSRRAMMLLGVITVLVIGGIAAGIVLRGGSQTETNLHRQKWLARPFNAYRIEFDTGRCRLSYEVRDEQIQLPLDAEPFTDYCYNAAFTISDLFDLIEQIPECGPNGCACDGPIETIVVYDAELGYPKRIQTVLNRDARVRYPSYWLKRISPFGSCTTAGFAPIKTEEFSLTPLP